MRILFTGGGTGGHLFPIIAIAREIRRLSDNQKIQLYYIGPKDEKARFLLSQESFKVHSIISGKIRRYFSFQNIIDVAFKIPFGFLQSFFLLLFIRPQLVFSKGGTGSLPITFCARLLRIPVFLHESDIVPGLSNKITSKWAKEVFTSFEKTEYFSPMKTILAGNPIREELLKSDNQSAREMFNLIFEKPIILILGGSQGSEAINDFILSILNDLLKHYEIIHVCGKKNYQKTQLASQLILSKDMQKYYHLLESLDEIQLKGAYKAADLIISRAGSSSIFEVAALGKSSIIIPLPSSAGNHQSKNAYEYSKNGATLVIEQENLSPNFFIGEINNAFSQSEKMRMAALNFSKPLASKKIAEEILKYLKIDETDKK